MHAYVYTSPFLNHSRVFSQVLLDKFTSFEVLLHPPQELQQMFITANFFNYYLDCLGEKSGL